MSFYHYYYSYVYFCVNWSRRELSFTFSNDMFHGYIMFHDILFVKIIECTSCPVPQSKKHSWFPSSSLPNKSQWRFETFYYYRFCILHYKYQPLAWKRNLLWTFRNIQMESGPEIRPYKRVLTPADEMKWGTEFSKTCALYYYSTEIQIYKLLVLVLNNFKATPCKQIIWSIFFLS